MPQGSNFLLINGIAVDVNTLDYYGEQLFQHQLCHSMYTMHTPFASYACSICTPVHVSPPAHVLCMLLVDWARCPLSYPLYGRLPALWCLWTACLLLCCCSGLLERL